MNFFKQDTTGKVLFVGYIILFFLCAINPYDRSDWWAENIPIAAIFIALVIAYAKGVKFSAVSYLFMAVLLYMHTIGGYYTFERVPFSFVDNLFGFKRNMYDRFAHFTVGFYAYPICELLQSRGLVKNKLVMFLFAIFAIGFVAMGYELIEWIFAVTNGGSAGIAFLGSQGDVWDAQKDMLMDTLGGITAGLIYLWRYKNLSI